MDYERCSRCSYLECDLDDCANRLAITQVLCQTLKYTLEQQKLDRKTLKKSLRKSRAEAQTNLKKIFKLKSELNQDQRKLSDRQLERRQDRDKIDKLMNENITLQEEQAASTETQDKLRTRLKQAREHVEAVTKAKNDSLAALTKALEEATTLLEHGKADTQYMESELKTKDDSLAALTERLEESFTLLERNKADKQDLQAELKAKEDFLGQHLSKLGKAEADVSALARDIETLESTEAELRRSIAGCWLHSFRAWRRKVTGSLTK